MEKISTGRRELAWGFSYTGIEALNALLQESYSKEQSKLKTTLIAEDIHLLMEKVIAKIM